MIRALFLVGAGLATTWTARAENLLTNGDFEQGNRGFSSDYNFYKGDTFPETTYAVLSSPRKGNPDGADFPDHTSGKGLMLVVNGGANPHLAFWRDVVTVADHQEYVFSGWVCSWGMAGAVDRAGKKGVDPNPSRFYVTINGMPCGEMLNVPAANGQWVRFAVSWDSGNATHARIELHLQTVAAFGNDFAMDDLRFGPANETDNESISVPPEQDTSAATAVQGSTPKQTSTWTNTKSLDGQAK